MSNRVKGDKYGHGTMGLRRGEALGLRREDVLTSGAVWRVSVTGQRDPASWVRAAPKTEKARRSLPVRPELRALLRPVLALPAASVTVGHGGSGESRQVPYLFPFQADGLDRLLAVLRGVDPEGFPSGDAWHVFRHTYAVEAERTGMPVQLISELLGHVDIAKTATYLRTLCGSRVTDDVLSYYARPPERPPPKTARVC